MMGLLWMICRGLGGEGMEVERWFKFEQGLSRRGKLKGMRCFETSLIQMGTEKKLVGKG